MKVPETSGYENSGHDTSGRETGRTENLNLQQTAQLLDEGVPGLPHDNEGPVFAEPWQAQVFAITLHLHEQKLFEWTEWASILAQKIREAQDAGDPDLGDTYYNHWLAALEHLLVEKELTTVSQLDELRDRWDKAARATPHGQPIEINPAL